MTFSVRPVEAKDGKHLASLLRENYKYPDGSSFDESLIQNRLDDQIATSLDESIPHNLFLGIVDNTPVAFAYVIADHKRGGFLVDDLFTRKGFEGRGIASTLLRFCEDYVRQQRKNEIHLNVLITDEPVKKFYKNRGWVKQIFKIAGHDGESEQTTDIDPYTQVPTHLLVKQL